MLTSIFIGISAALCLAIAGLFVTRVWPATDAESVHGRLGGATMFFSPSALATRTYRLLRSVALRPKTRINLRRLPRSPARLPDSSAEAVSSGQQRPRRGNWGLVPYFVLLGSAAATTIAVADALSRSGRTGGQALFWLAVLVTMGMAAARLALPMPPRVERIGIVLVMGMLLYFVKILKDPFRFMNSDEPIHAYNAQQVVDTGSLFHPNPLLPVTPNYVGLPSMTDAVASLSGLHVFGSGLVVIGVARLVMILGLFLLFEDVSRSARIAGLATLFYMAHPNFIFFTGQFAYESLAFPIAIIGVAATNRWMHLQDPQARRGWAVTALVATSAVVMTHHMTTYALVGFLFLASVVHALIRDRTSARNPWPFAAFAFLAAMVWLTFVASETAGYLTTIFGQAVRDTVRTIAFEAAPRKLFNTETGGESPWGERVVGLASIALIAGIMPVALLEAWRRYRHHTVGVVLALAGAGYVGVVFLRLVPKAWEIGNRASEFLFIGVGFMFALASAWAVARLPRPFGRASVVGAAVLVLAGGIIAGWPSDLRLSLPYRVKVGDRILFPEGTTAADWARANLGTQRHFLADQSNARLQLSEGQVAFAGGSPDLDDILREPMLAPWMVDVMRERGINFLIMDRREISQNQSFGNYFFTERAARLGLFPTSITTKFDRQPGISKIYDSGNLSIYNLDLLRYDPRNR